MDALDLRILRLLTWKPADPVDATRTMLSPWDVARELDVHGNTVKRRLEAMRELGVFSTLHLVPEPSLAGVQGFSCRLFFSDTLGKVEAMERVHDLPGTRDSLTFVGDEAWVSMIAPAGADAEEVAAHVAREAGAEGWELNERFAWDADASVVRELDMRIMGAMSHDAFRSVSDVAAEAGVTPRTVRARLKALAKARAFMVAPDIRPERIRGFIPFILAIEPEEPGEPPVLTRLANAFPEAFYRSFPTASTPYLYLASETSEGVEDLVLRAQRLDGVAEARALLVKGSTACHLPDQPIFDMTLAGDAGSAELADAATRSRDDAGSPGTP